MQRKELLILMFSFLTDSELQTRIQYVWKLDAIKNNALEK